MTILKRRVAGFAPVIAALALAAPVAPVAPAIAAAPAGPAPVVTGPSCPEGYHGPTNLATGCPYWLMSYTVQYPGQPPFRCPVNAGTPSSGDMAGRDSAARVGDRCDVVAK